MNILPVFFRFDPAATSFGDQTACVLIESASSGTSIYEMSKRLYFNFQIVGLNKKGCGDEWARVRYYSRKADDENDDDVEAQAGYQL